MKKIIFIISIIHVMLLSACGFHLKGTQIYDKLPEDNWVIDGGALQQPLENALRYANGRPINPNNINNLNINKNHLKYLKIISYETQKDIYTITRAAKLNEYLLSMRVVAQAYHENGEKWGEPIMVETKRTMSYSDSMILGKQEDESTLWQEIQQDMSNQIIRRLGFLNLN